MRVLRLRKSRFRVIRQPLDSRVFSEWLGGRGRVVLDDALRQTRFRWLMGKRRARRRLFREAKRVFAPRSTFSQALEERLNSLTDIIRRLGLSIRKKEYKDLYTADSARAVVVVPRGWVQIGLAAFLIDEMSASPLLGRFPGLARRVLEPMAREAETLMCEYVSRGRQLVDSTGRGLLAAVDADYRWRINEADGHYLFAYALQQGDDLGDRRRLRRYRAEMMEVLRGQEVYLKRLSGHERAAIADVFRHPLGV